MICLRCGYCCVSYDVIIVDDPGKGIRKDNLKYKPHGELCQHLQGDTPGNYACALHDYNWYKKTPCFSHGQIERSPSDHCRMGDYRLKKEEIK